MPNIAQVLKEEIRRLAKKEAKALTGDLKKDVVRLKKSNVAMRREVALLKRDNDLLMASERRRQQTQPAVAPETASKARITSKGIRALRRKLGLSQAEMATLAGVTSVSVGNWENKGGALRLKDGTRAAVLSLRGLGAREAKRRLEMVAAKKVVGRKKARRRARK